MTANSNSVFQGDDVPSAAPASGPMDINTAIQEVLKQALIADGLARYELSSNYCELKMQASAA